MEMIDSKFEHVILRTSIYVVMLLVSSFSRMSVYIARPVIMM